MSIFSISAGEMVAIVLEHVVKQIDSQQAHLGKLSLNFP